MKALVTGASGFTGSHLVQALFTRGDQVVAFVRPTSDRTRLSDSGCQVATGDITDLAALTAAMQGVDVVFHTAAYVELGLVNAERMHQVNVVGTQTVLQAAWATGVKKVVYCSTIGVYGDTQGQVVDETFQRTQADFSSAYDRTKLLAQEQVDQAAQQGLFTVSVMPSGIFGPDDPHFGPVLQQYFKGRLKLWVGGDRITGIVHVDDLVQAMLLAAERGQCGGHYIISTGELTTREMFAVLSQVTGIPVPGEVPPPVVRFLGNLLEPLGRLLHWQPPLSRERVHYLYDRCVRVDATRARTELGWQPRSMESTLRSLIPANLKLTLSE